MSVDEASCRSPRRYRGDGPAQRSLPEFRKLYLYAIADALKHEYWAIVDTACGPTGRSIDYRGWDQMLPNIDLKNFRNFVEHGSKRPITRWRRIHETASAVGARAAASAAWHGRPHRPVQSLFLKVKPAPICSKRRTSA